MNDYFSKKHIIRFLIVTFCWSYPVGIFGYGWLYGDKLLLRYLFAVLFMLGPTFGALTTGIIKDKTRMKRYFRGVGIGLIAIIIGAVLIEWFVPAIVEMLFLDGGLIEEIPNYHLVMILMAFTIGFVGAFGEEFGWRGYLLEAFSQKMSWIKSTILLGVIWGFWHFPIALGTLVKVMVDYGLDSAEFIEKYPLVMTACGGMIGASIAMSFAFAAIWLKSENIITVSFAHGFHNAVRDSVGVLFLSLTSIGTWIYIVAFFIILIISVIVVLKESRKRSEVINLHR